MSKSEEKILRVGIIGCGDIFQSHSQAYPDHPNAVLVGFYDRIKSRAEAWLEHITRYMGYVKEGAEDEEDDEDILHLKRCAIFEKEGKVYNNVQELLENVDVIDVCAPNYAHAPYAIWALKQNKSVMTEKPPAKCSLETKRIIETAKNSKGLYQINENFFWQVFVRELKKVIDSGKIGKVTKMNTMLGHGGPSWGWNNHFLNPSLSGGGCLSDMGIHAIGFGFGVIGPEYKIKKIKSLRMKSGTKPERNMKDSDGANQYYLHRFMVEDDAKTRVWLTHEKTNDEIAWTIESSWSKTFQAITLDGTEGTCGLELDDKKRMIIAVYKTDGEREIINIPGQGRDSHQLEVIDFLSRIAKGEKAYVDEHWSHKMQTIISGSYLSNLLGFEKGKRKGEEVTPEDLDKFYQQIIDSECPENILLEEIIFRFMSPFTETYFTPGEKFGTESETMKPYDKEEKS
jgi:predicted dehydrogenase